MTDTYHKDWQTLLQVSDSLVFQLTQIILLSMDLTFGCENRDRQNVDE